MKVYCYSDLHTEFYNTEIRKAILPQDFKDADLVIFAGDCAKFSQIPTLIEWVEKLGKKLIYIPGNHEFYGRTYEDLERLVLASNQVYEINGKRIVTSTLWTTIPSIYEEIIERGMTDFRVIKGFTPKKQNEINKKCKDFILQELEKNKVDIVVTHHAPSYKSVLPQWERSLLNPAFANEDLDNFIKEHGPRYWFHGHMHNSMRYMIGNTVVFTNPFGYINIDKNPEFNKSLFIEI